MHPTGQHPLSPPLGAQATAIAAAYAGSATLADARTPQKVIQRIDELKAKVFPDRPVKTLQPDPKSGGLQVVER